MEGSYQTLSPHLTDLLGLVQVLVRLQGQRGVVPPRTCLQPLHTPDLVRLCAPVPAAAAQSLLS